MSRSTLYVVLAALCLSPSAFADRIEQFVMARAVGGIAAPLKVKVDDNGDLLGLLVYSPDPGVNPDYYSVDQIRSGADIGVADAKGSVHHGVFLLKSPGLDPHTGGDATLRWTENVIFRKHGEIGVRVARGDDGKWHIFSGQTIIRTLAITPGSLGIDNVTAVALLADEPDTKEIDETLKGSKSTAVANVETDKVIKHVDDPAHSPDRAADPAAAHAPQPVEGSIVHI